MTLIIPVNHEADSVDQLQRIVNKLENASSYINAAQQVDDTFAVYDRSVVRKRSCEGLGAKEVTMTKLQPWLVEELSLKSLSITTAINDGQFHLWTRQRLQTVSGKNFTPKSNRPGNCCCRQNHERDPKKRPSRISTKSFCKR